MRRASQRLNRLNSVTLWPVSVLYCVTKNSGANSLTYLVWGLRDKRMRSSTTLTRVSRSSWLTCLWSRPYIDNDRSVDKVGLYNILIQKSYQFINVVIGVSHSHKTANISFPFDSVAQPVNGNVYIGLRDAITRQFTWRWYHTLENAKFAGSLLQSHIA